MGFDSDCVLNIQTVAGEYFCPVCRSLIYPNEALQSQCTHLYCKPCLAYVVSTTRACPYDGYLVTEADSKPLIESNKALADTIGMVKVHCLYHRSGCTWEGPLSESASHCSGCSFGNSAVVCNRCGIQIVHRQVQEHAQNCPVVAQGESTQVAVSAGTAAATHVGTSVIQAQHSQQASQSTQSQSSIQAAVPTAEQWYQQQQQYYQQYPGYDPYQLQYQQYYPYQQPAAVQQPQSQAYMQPVAAQPQPQVQPLGPMQTQPQPHLHSQQPTTQIQSQPQVNSQIPTHSLTQPQPQIQPQTQPPPGGQHHPQATLHPQTLPVQPHPQAQLPPYQQPQPQPQIPPYQQPQPQIPPYQQPQPQTQNPVTQQPVQPPQQSFAQSNQLVNPHLQPQIQSQHSSTHAVTGHHSYPQFQPQQQMQPAGPHMYSQGGVQPQSQHPVQMQNQFPQQAPPLRPPQPAGHHQYVQQQQQPFPGQAPGSVQSHVHPQIASTHQHLHVQSQLRPQGQSLPSQQPSHAYPHQYQNVALPHGMQPVQTQNVGGRPMAPSNGVPMQPHPYSSVGLHGKPMQAGTVQQSGNAIMTNDPMLFSSEQHSGVTSRPMPERQGAEIPVNSDKRNPKDVDVTPGLDANASEVTKVKTESDTKHLNDENKPIDEASNASKSLASENGEHLLKKVKNEPADGFNGQKDLSVADNKQLELSIAEDKNSQGVHALKSFKNLSPQPPGGYGLTAHQRPVGSSSLQEPPPGSSHHMQFPGHASAQIRPSGPGNIAHLGHPLNPLPEHLQQASHKQPYGPEVSPGLAGPGFTSNFGRGQGRYESNMLLNQRPSCEEDRRLDPLGQQPGSHLSAVKTNGAPGVDSSLGLGLHDDRWRPLPAPEVHMNPFPQDPARRIFERGKFEEDLKHFPRASDLDNDSVQKFESHFLSSRPPDRGAHGFGPEKLEALGGRAPSRFFPHHHDGPMHPNEIGERPIGFHDKNAVGQHDPSPGRDFFGPTSRYETVPRSLHRDHASHRFGPSRGANDVDGRESHHFGDSFPGSRFPVLRSHLHRGEFEGSVRGVENFGPPNLPGHRGEPIGFDGFRGPARMGELPGPGNFFHPLPGEPGYRSNFPLKGDVESFDNLRRKKPFSMGWCRICKLDCETVEGLDLHSQTRDHQKKALDMVLIIKQNAKRQKLASGDKK